MAYRNGHYICDRCGAVCQGIGHSKGWTTINSGAICPRCKELEKQTKLLEKQNKILERQANGEEYEEHPVAKALGEKLSSIDFGSVASSSKIVMKYILFWWVYLLYYLLVYPAKLIIKGVKESEKKNIVIGTFIYVFVITITIISVVSVTINTNKFKFVGLDDSVSVVYGEKYEYLTGVSLKKNNETVNGTITYNGSVDSNTLGDYIVTYTGTYDDQTITKDVKVRVVPFYNDPYYGTNGVYVLKNFTIQKISSYNYTISGTITNNSGKKYSKMTVEYYCSEHDIKYTLNFDQGLPLGDNDFTINVESTEPIEYYNFKILKITYK